MVLLTLRGGAANAKRCIGRIETQRSLASYGTSKSAKMPQGGTKFAKECVSRGNRAANSAFLLSFEAKESAHVILRERRRRPGR